MGGEKDDKIPVLLILKFEAPVVPQLSQQVRHRLCALLKKK